MKEYGYSLLDPELKKGSNKWSKQTILLAIIGGLYMLFTAFYFIYSANYNNNFGNEEVIETASMFLIETEGCKIRSFNPFDAEIMATTKIEPYKPCEKVEEITFMDFNKTSKEYTLKIKEEFLKFNISVKCSYQNIVRKSEATIEYDYPVNFTSEIVIPSPIENIFVSCYFNNTRVFKNAYAIMRNKRTTHETSDNAISLIIFGIDSISRNSLIRNMPKTWAYLQSQEYWFNFPGYNRVS